MTTLYIVCKTCPACLPSMAGMGLPRKALEEASWNAPILEDTHNCHPRVFTNVAEARAYCDRMNEEKNKPIKEKDGSFTIDISPYAHTNYIIIPIQKGTAKKPVKRGSR